MACDVTGWPQSGVKSQVRGPGLWKFNASLLQDNEFCAIIEDRISYLSSCIDYFPSVKSWWDFFKTSLKSEIVFFSRIRRRCLSRERVFLVNRLVSLKRRLTSGDCTVATEISRLESELKALISSHATPNTETPPNSASISGPSKTTTSNTLFPGAFSHRSRRTTAQAKDVTSASKKNC